MFKTFEALPAFTDYVARIHDRPAFKRASELDDAAMAETNSGRQADAKKKGPADHSTGPFSFALRLLDQSRLPISCSRKVNMLTKSR